MSDDEPTDRRRRKTQRGRRLRVPVDEVPRQRTASAEATLDEGDLEEIASTPPAAAEVAAPVVVQARPPAPVAPARVSAVAAPARVSASAPPARVSAVAAPARVSTVAAPARSSVTPEPARSSVTPESPRNSVVVHRSVVVAGSPAAAPTTKPVPVEARTTKNPARGELPPLDAEVTIPGVRAAPSGAEVSRELPVLPPAPTFPEETSTELTVEDVPDPADFAGLDDAGDGSALAAEPTRVNVASAPPPSLPTPPAAELPSVIVDVTASLADDVPPEPTAAATSAGRGSIPPEELATEDLAPAEAATAHVSAPPRPAPPPAPPVAGVRPPPAPPTAPRVAPVAASPAAVAPVAAPATTPAEVAVPVDAAEAPKRKKRAKVWWEDFFNDDYLRTVRPPKPEQVVRQCNFLELSLGLQKGATILDVGCGLGLQAVELASRGYLVVGLDLSLPMLSRAADEAQDREIKMNFLHGDMREMSFDGAFDAVLCLGTTFGYFDDDANRQVLERMKRALKPEGLLLLDVVNRDFVVQGQPNQVWFEGDGCLCMEETQFNYITSRLHVKRTVIVEDGRQRENEYGIRLYPLHEVGQLMHQMGFRVAEVSGMEATPGVYFGATSPRLIILAERRVERPSGTVPALNPGATPPPSPPSPPSEPARPSPPGEDGGAGEGSSTPAA